MPNRVGHRTYNIACGFCFPWFSVPSLVAAGVVEHLQWQNRNYYSNTDWFFDTAGSLMQLLILTMQIKLAVMMMTMMMRMIRRLRLSCPLQVPSEPRASDRISEFPRSLCSLCSSAILSGSNVLHGHLISLCLSKETGSKAMAPWPQVPAVPAELSHRFCVA